MKVTRCAGEGQGSCKRCTDKGKWADIAEDPEKLPNMVENLLSKAEEAEAEQIGGGKWVNIAEELEKEGLL